VTGLRDLAVGHTRILLRLAGNDYRDEPGIYGWLIRTSAGFLSDEEAAQWAAEDTLPLAARTFAIWGASAVTTENPSLASELLCRLVQKPLSGPIATIGRSIYSSRSSTGRSLALHNLIATATCPYNYYSKPGLPAGIFGYHHPRRPTLAAAVTPVAAECAGATPHRIWVSCPGAADRAAGGIGRWRGGDDQEGPRHGNRTGAQRRACGRNSCGTKMARFRARREHEMRCASGPPPLLALTRSIRP
jgi:hypothetical protein